MGVSPDRVYRELKNLLLLASRPAEGLRILRSSGVLEKMHPWLNDLIGCQQENKNTRRAMYGNIL